MSRKESTMRTLPSASRDRPLAFVAGLSGYAALITLIIVLVTTSGVVAGIAAALTLALLVGSYWLERWARRRTVYSPAARSSPATRATADMSATKGTDGEPRNSEDKAALMATV